MGVGVISTLLFYWLVRCKGQMSENEDVESESVRRVESVDQILSFAAKRRIASKEKDLVS